MFYLKSTDFAGVFELPSTFFQPNIEARIEQRERVNINYVLGKDLGDLFYADLNVSGNPVSPRFVAIDSMLRSAVLGLTFIEVFTYLKSINSPTGIATVNSDTVNRYPYEVLAQTHDEAIDYAKQLRQYISSNSQLYPEFCKCCLQQLRYFIF